MLNKTVTLAGILLLTGFMGACGNQQSNHTEEVNRELEAPEHYQNPEDPHHNLNIELNAGNRWAVNEEMKPYVEQGEAALKSYLHRGDTDYKTLAVEINAANKGLISSCTMTGKSHDELHKWLHPHLELVTKLETEGNEAYAQEIIVDLEKSYQNYHKYFK